jgi:hypothetical protein
MTTLREALEMTSWRTLRAMGRQRGLRLSSNIHKAELVDRLVQVLPDPDNLDTAMALLAQPERHTLGQVLAAGGRLPGRYLPQAPLAALRHLGLVFYERATEDVFVPQELIPLLPAPEHAPPPLPAPEERSYELALVAAHDLACLLALLQREDVRPLHGCWLPPRLLATWGEMCAWPPAAPHVRSELQAGRRRFLHYLAEVAGLLGRAGPYLTPTPAAWLWLASPPAGRLNKLWHACVLPGDRHPAPDSQRDRIWRAYRLPGHGLLPAPTRLATTVAHAMRDLDPAHPAAFAEALLARQPELRDLLPANLFEPHAALATTIVQLLAGPFVWLGALSDRRGKGAGEQHRPGTGESRLELTAWGAAWLGLAPAPEVPPPPRFGVTSEAASDSAAGEPGALIFTLRQGMPDPAHLMVMEETGIRESGVRESGIRTQGIRDQGIGDQAIGSSGRGPSSPDFLSPPARPPGRADSLSPDSLSPDSLSPDSYRITPASFARALQRGWSAPALLDALEHLAERPLTGQERAMLRAWAEAAGRMAVRRLTVLEVTDPAIISHLAATRRGRDLIVRTLSPRAVVVDEARLDLLVRRLTHQEGVPPAVWSWEYGVGSRESGVRSRGSGGALHRGRPSRRDARTPNSLLPTPYSRLPSLRSSGAAHVWLALRVYQGLGEIIRLPARTPQTLLEYLAALADEDDLAAAETAAERVLNALREAMIGRVSFPPYPEDGLPLAESLALIRQALAGGQALEMDYYTAGRDVITHRIVEPYRLEERHGVHYLVGFCHRAQAERVFRLDRIRAIARVPWPEEGRLDQDWLAGPEQDLA